MNAESLVIPRDGVSHPLHRRLEILMARVDIEPFFQYRVRRQGWELFDDRGPLNIFRANQDTMPLPAACLGRFNQDHHHAAEQVSRESTEHSLGEKAGMLF